MNYLYWKNCKNDYICIIVLTIIFTLLLLFSTASWGSAVIDCFRNAYVPWQILEGKTLYSEIYYIYGPLIAYFHSLLFYIWGISLNTLYISGITVSFLILLSFYCLCRHLMTPYISFISSFSAMILVMFRPGIFQYIFPYSFEAVYSTLLILLLLNSLIFFVKSNYNKPFFLLSGSIIVSLIPLIKQDSTLFAYIIFYIFLISLITTNKIIFKSSFQYLLLPVIVPVCFYSILSLFIPLESLYQGIFPFDTIHTTLIISFPEKGLVYSLFTAVILLLFIACVSFIYCFLSYYIRKLSQHEGYIMMLISVIAFIYIIFYFDSIQNLFIVKVLTGQGLLSWILLFNCIYLAIMLFSLYKKAIMLDEKRFILLILLVSSIIMLVRTPFFVSLSTSSNFYILPSILILLFVLFCDNPCQIKARKKKVFKNSLIFSIMLILLLNSLLFYKYYSEKTITINSTRGYFKTGPLRGHQINSALNYINKYTNKNDTILALPEETLFYFMAERSAASKYYQFLPGITSSRKTETFIIKELEETKPAMILISSNEVATHYGFKHVGLDYNNNLLSWIKDHYKLIKIIQAPIKDLKVISPYRIYIYLNNNRQNNPANHTINQ